MTRTSLPIAVALAASAGLLLTACGGSGSSSDKITSSATTPTSAAPTTTAPSPTASDTVKRPSTALPKDLTMTFDWSKTGDATKDAVLNDGEQYIRALKRASANDDLKDPAYQFYSRDDALSYAHDQIKANVDGGYAPTGQDHYYDANVKIVRTGSATLTFCRDQSKVFSKVVKTGKVIRSAPNADSFILYNVLLVKDGNSNGVWQSSQITVIEGAKQCQV
ncbi:hypothetical protein [Actinacidiphila acidipaludis]|uniref:Lipoprotein n=1 Tax=Actinacidiphila acidipaludis TaxID=2873382 RepID=A0ABS7QLK3_9ACTN|nr:hypothetical protein [Streptomyces acidipaludis]MBY8882767.1 hypothetical protein [Streptomyces acidipaludis]